MDVGWSELQSDLLEMISEKLTVYADYIRFRAVCLKWRSTIPTIPRHLPCQFPWLMLPSRQHRRCRNFFSLPENKVHVLTLHEAYMRRCCGSSQGWLVLIEEKCPDIFLLNPLTRVQIQLPPLTTFPNILDFNIENVGDEYLLQRPSDGKQYTRDLNRIRDFFIKKIIISSSNSTYFNEDYIAIAIVHSTLELAFCKKGDEAWTVIQDALGYCEDVIYYKGLLYAVNMDGSLAICDVFSDISPMVTVIVPPLPIVSRIFNLVILYLVDSFGELLLVKRYLEVVDGLEVDSLGYKTVHFDVFRLDSSAPKWVEVNNLGNHMLFLGTNSSLCLSATDFSGCEGNCIYFSASYNSAYGDGSWNYDTGAFNVGDGSFKPLANCTGYFGLSFTPPVWVTPNPC